MPAVYDALGIYIPLIVVNCIILGRAESYASKNGIVESAFDGIGMGLGFTIALTCIGFVRELLGAGSVFGRVIIPEDFHISILVMAPGAFFVLACLTALQNKFKMPSATNVAGGSSIVCGGNCTSCSETVCAENHKKIAAAKAEEAKKAAAEKAAKAEAAKAKKAAEAAAAETKPDGNE